MKKKLLLYPNVSEDNQHRSSSSSSSSSSFFSSSSSSSSSSAAAAGLLPGEEDGATASYSVADLRTAGYTVLNHTSFRLLMKYDVFLFDCDGVLWTGPKVVPGALEALHMLRYHGKRILFVTNNGCKHRRVYQKKLSSLGLQVQTDQIITSAYSTAQYLKMKHPEVRKVFVTGENGLVDELEEAGLEVVKPRSDTCITDPADFLMAATQLDEGVQAVVVGFDNQFSYNSVCIASLYLQRKHTSTLFLATNRDPFDVIQGLFMPGSGALVMALEAATGLKAICVGKPSSWLAEHVINRDKLNRTRSIFIGDRLETDIAFARAAGMHSAVTLTGCCTAAQLIKIPTTDASAPTYVLPSVGLLASGLASNEEYESSDNKTENKTDY